MEFCFKSKCGLTSILQFVVRQIATREYICLHYFLGFFQQMIIVKIFLKNLADQPATPQAKSGNLDPINNKSAAFPNYENGKT